jgi:glycosyltransferase involved in cell wall biosynthesis
MFISPSRFIAQRMIDAGYPQTQMAVVPNKVLIPEFLPNSNPGRYAAFAGRMVKEKGVATLVNSMTLLPQIPMRLAGDGPLMPWLKKHSPENITLTGQLSSENLIEFYRNSRFVVIPSICFDNFPLVELEAMSHGIPVIASKMGGLVEIVEDGVTGLLYEADNHEELSEKIKLLWENPDLCQKMGMAGREKAIHEYNQDVYYERLMAVYRQAIKNFQPVK